jgi:hypothetical protein
MSTDELRTAAIEAAETAISEVWAKYGSFAQMAESVVDAIAPLLIAETASRIADVIEAERDQTWPHGPAGDWGKGHSDGMNAAIAIARRVGESNG